MKRFVLTDSAKGDLDDIWFYIAQESGSVIPAERAIWRLHKAIVSLAASPGIGHTCKDIDPQGRCFPVGDYLIYYRKGPKRIAITHIFHGKRDQAKAWREPERKKER